MTEWISIIYERVNVYKRASVLLVFYLFILNMILASGYERLAIGSRSVIIERYILLLVQQLYMSEWI